MKLYNTKGTAISILDFYKIYEPMYYNDYIYKDSIIKMKSSRFVEQKIDEILKNGVTPDDFKLIIAWKIGAISHRQSENKGKVVYSANYEDTLRWDIKGTDAAPMIEYLSKNYEYLLSIADDPYKLYCELHRPNIKGFGHVYIITLMNFISRGNVPIYDRFSCTGSLAIEHEVKPYEVVEYKYLSQDMDKAWEEYLEFIKRLKNIFGKHYAERKVDRSIFVYGHCFDN